MLLTVHIEQFFIFERRVRHGEIVSPTGQHLPVVLEVRHEGDRRDGGIAILIHTVAHVTAQTLWPQPPGDLSWGPRADAATLKLRFSTSCQDHGSSGGGGGDFWWGDSRRWLGEYFHVQRPHCMGEREKAKCETGKQGKDKKANNISSLEYGVCVCGTGNGQWSTSYVQFTCTVSSHSTCLCVPLIDCPTLFKWTLQNGWKQWRKVALLLMSSMVNIEFATLR